MNTSLFDIRGKLGLSTTEAAKLVHVTRRTWELWESGIQIMPKAKQELFMMKLNEICNKHDENSQLIVIVSDDGSSALGVASSDKFIDCKEIDNNIFNIRYLSIDKQTMQPCVNSIKFIKYPHNEHVIKATQTWKSILE